MFIQYHSLDIAFSVGGTRFRALNIARERLERIIPNHSHGADSYEFHFTASGRGQVLAGGALWPLAPGSFYVVGPHVDHAQIPDPDDPQVDECVYLQRLAPERADAPTCAAAAALVQRNFRLGHGGEAMRAVLNRLFAELDQRRAGYTIWVETLLTQLVLCAVRDTGEALPAESFQPATPEEARAFMIEEAFLYEYTVLTLDGLARRLGLGTRQTERLLRERYGKTFRQKRAEARLSAAEILLSRTRRSVSSIAEELGYASAEHFAAAFRRHSGMSATAYRRRHRIDLPGGAEPVLDPPEGLGSAFVPGRETVQQRRFPDLSKFAGNS